VGISVEFNEMGDKEKRVFVSYAAQDGAVATRLKERLKAATNGALSFFVSGDGDSILLGANWSVSMAKALRTADAVLVLVSQYSERSSWVLYEIGYASASNKLVIPVLLPGYPLNRMPPPLAPLQHIAIESADSLRKIVERLGVLPDKDISNIFTTKDVGYIFGEDSFRGREGAMVEAISLQSRDDFYWELMRLVKASGKDARIRAASTLYDTAGAKDLQFDRYIETIAGKIGDAKLDGGVADYTLVMSCEIDEDRLPPRERQLSIRNRQAAFEKVGALDRITVYRRAEYWRIEIFILGEDHVVIGFPLHADSSMLHHGVRISGRDFVMHVGHWFEACVRNGAAMVDPITLRVQDSLGEQ
jgi:hypothetical protein